ncbi:MAG: hypothetical protein KDI60_11805, partial [Xanthomonadales bacterium]|nr:hypothetical protein [Xanthomonadales bacterium]
MTARELAARWSTLDVDCREQQLAELRGSDPALAREVEALLAAVTMETAAPEVGSDAGVPADLERIGPYRILDRIGSGGMGSVYLALQPNPERRVALKT